MASFDSAPAVKFDAGMKLDSGPGPGPAQPKKHPMADPALKLSSLTRNETKILAASLAAGLTANAALVPAPKVTPAQLTTAVTNVVSQEVVVKNAEENLSAQRKILVAKDEALDLLMTSSVEDSTNTVSRDGTKMTMLNIPIRAVPGPTAPGASSPPQNFSMTNGDHTGEADGHCNAVKGAKLYRAQSAPASGGPYTTGYEGTKSRFTISGLPPGQLTWFQMAAFVAGEWTDWSDPASCRIV